MLGNIKYIPCKFNKTGAVLGDAHKPIGIGEGMDPQIYWVSYSPFLSAEDFKLNKGNLIGFFTDQGQELEQQLKKNGFMTWRDKRVTLDEIFPKEPPPTPKRKVLPAYADGRITLKTDKIDVTDNNRAFIKGTRGLKRWEVTQYIGNYAKTDFLKTALKQYPISPIAIQFLFNDVANSLS